MINNSWILNDDNAPSHSAELYWVIWPEKAPNTTIFVQQIEVLTSSKKI